MAAYTSTVPDETTLLKAETSKEPVGGSKPTKIKKPANSDELKTSIWDDLFGGTKTKRQKNPKDLDEFREQVNGCITLLNKKLTETGLKGNAIQTLDPIPDFKSLDQTNSFPLPADFKKSNFCYNPQRDLIAFWTEDKVEVFSIAVKEDGFTFSFSPEFEFDGLPPLFHQGPVRFTRNGKFLIVLTTKDVRCYVVCKILAKKDFRVDDKYKATGIPNLLIKEDMPGFSDVAAELRVVLTSYGMNAIGSIFEGNRYLMSKFDEPDSFTMALAIKDTLLCINILFGETETLVMSAVDFRTVDAGEHFKNYLDGLDQKKGAKKKKQFSLSKAWHTATLEFEANQTRVTYYELKHDKYARPTEFQEVSTHVVNVGLDPSRIQDTKEMHDTVVLAAADQKSIYSIEMQNIDRPEGPICRKLFDLPASVSNINQITYDPKLEFVLLNVNLGELHIWGRAASNGRNFQLIYKKELPEQQAYLYLTADLESILLFVRNSLTVMQFDPFRNDSKASSFHIPWVMNEIFQGYIPDGDDKFCKFFPFKNTQALLYVMRDKVFVYNISKLSHYPKELKGQFGHKLIGSSFQSTDVITLIEDTRWLFFMSYTEKSNVTQSVGHGHKDQVKAGQSHFKAFSIKFDSATKDYNIEQILDITAGNSFEFLNHQNVVLLHQLHTQEAACLKFSIEHRLGGKVAIQHTTFDLAARLGVEKLTGTTAGSPLVALLNGELGIIIRRPQHSELELQLSDDEGQSKSPSQKSVSATNLNPSARSPLNQVGVRPRAVELRPQPLLGTGQYQSDEDSELEGQNHVVRFKSEYDPVKGPKSYTGYDPEPDNDSMDENYLKLEHKSSAKYNKRPAPGQYEIFRYADLFLPQSTGRLKPLATGKVHCSGANFVKMGPSSDLLCLYGKTGFEVLRLKQKTAGGDPYSQRMEGTAFLEDLQRILKNVKEQIPGEQGANRGDGNLPPLPRSMKNNSMSFMQVPQELDRSPNMKITAMNNGFCTTVPVTCFVASAKLVTLRFRWKPRYRISSPQSVEISSGLQFGEDGKPTTKNWIAVAFDNNKQYLYEVSSASGRIKPRLLSEVGQPKEFPFLFQFKRCRSEYMGKDQMLLAYVERINPKGPAWFSIYSIDKQLGLRRLGVMPEFYAVNLSFEMDQIAGSHIGQLVLKHKLVSRTKIDIESDFHIGYLMDQSKFRGTNLPYGSILLRNLRDYLDADDPTSESFSLELLQNSFSSVSITDVFQDPRICFMAYVLNQPEFFKQAMRNVFVEDLISTNYLLQLVFSNLNPPRPNSEADIADMYKQAVHDRQVQPIVPKDWIRDLIEKVDLDSLTGTLGCKQMLSTILLTPTGQKIKGLTKAKDISMIPFPEAEIYQHNLRKDIVINKVDCLLLSNPSKSNEYDIYKSSLKLELTNGSDFSIGFFQMLQQLPDEELRYKYKQIINYKWRMVYFHSLVYTLLYVTLNVLAYLFFGYMGKTWMGILVLILNAMFIILDVSMFGANLLIFSKNLNSWIDIIVHSISAASSIIILFNLISQPNVILYIKVIAILAVSVRGIIQLKVFSGIRILILLIGTIIVDLIWVPLVLGVIYLLAGSIYTLIPQPDGSPNNLTFYEAMRQTFFLLFLPVADSSEASTDSNGRFIRSFITLVAGSMFIQGIFNFVIAIFLQTFKKVNENKDVYELKSLLIEISDYDLMMRSLPFLSREVKYYYLVLVPVPKDGVVFENESQFDRINNIKDSIMVEMGKKSMELMGEQAEKLFEGKKAEIEKLVQLGKENAKPTDPRVQKLAGMLDKLAKDGTQPEMSDLTNIADIMADTLDDKSRAVVKSTKDAVTKVTNMLSTLNSGETPSAKMMIDIVITMASALDPEGKNAIVQKLNGIKQTILKVFQAAENIKNSSRLDVPVLIDSAILVAGELTSGKLKDNLVGIGGAIKAVAEEAESMSLGQPADIKKLVENTLQVFQMTPLADKLNKSAASKPLLTVASVLTEILKHQEEFKNEGYKDPDVLLLVGGDISEAIFPEHNVKPFITSGRGILKAVTEYRKLSAQTTSTKVSLAASIVPHAGTIVEAVFPESAKSVKVVLSICSAIEKAATSIEEKGKITLSDVSEAVSPLIQEHLGPKGQQAVKAVIEILKLAERESEALSKDLNRASTNETIKKLPALIQSVSSLLKLFCDDHQKIQQVLDMAIMTTQLVQSRIESSQAGTPLSDNILESCIVAIDIISIISPKVQSASAPIKQGIKVFNNQLKNFSAGQEKFDLELLLSDVQLLVEQHKQEWVPLTFKVASITRELMKLYQEAKQLGKGSEVAMLKLTANTVSRMMPELFKYTDAVTKLAELGEEMASSASKERTLDLAKIYQLTSGVVLHFQPRLYLQIDQARPIFMMVNNLVQQNKPLDTDSLKSMIASVAEVVKQIEPKTNQAVDVAARFGVGVLEWIQLMQNNSEDPFKNTDLESLLQPLCELCCLLKEDLRPLVSNFKSVATAIQASIMTYKKEGGDQMSSIVQIVNSLGTVAQQIDPKFAQPVDKLNRVVGAVQLALKEYEQPTIAGVYKLVDTIGQLICDCDNSLQVRVSQTMAVLKLITNELQMDQPTNLGVQIAGQRIPVDAVFEILRSILNRYNSQLLRPLEKIELVISALVLQISSYEKTGTLELETCVSTATSILRDLAPQLEKPCRIFQASISIVASIASRTDLSANFKPSTLDWSRLTAAVTDIAEVCDFEGRHLITSVGVNLQPILAQLESFSTAPLNNSNFSKLLAAVMNLMSDVNPKYSRNLQVVLDSVTKFETVISSQILTGKFEPISIMTCAVSILAENQRQYSIDIMAYEALFKEAQDQIQRIGSSKTPSLKEALGSLSKVLSLIANIVERYDSQQSLKLKKLQSIIDIVIKANSTLSKSPKIGELIELADSMATGLEFPKLREATELLKIVKVFEEQHSYPPTPLDFKSLGESTSVLLEAYLPNEAKLYMPTVNRLASLLLEIARKASEFDKKNLQISAITETALRLLSIVKPDLEPPAYQIHTMVLLVEEEASRFQKQNSSGSTMLGTIRRLSQTLQRVLAILAPQQSVRLEPVVRTFIRIQEAVESQGLSLEGMSQQEGPKILQEILKQLGPQVLGGLDLKLVSDSIIALYDSVRK